MTYAERTERLHDIVDRLLERENKNYLSKRTDPFDVERPNIHETKTEFRMEKDAVEATISALDTAFSNMMGQKEYSDDERRAMFSRLTKAVGEISRQRASEIELKTHHDLIRKNIADAGIYLSGMFAIRDLSDDLSARLKELKTQEELFWSAKNRPPNHYARVIALRLAKLYAQKKGKKPTFGTSRDGPFPSTDFGRALEEVFAVLGISAKVTGPAKWAISQLTEADLQPPKWGLLGALGFDAALNADPDEQPEESNFSKITRLMMKGSEK